MQRSGRFPLGTPRCGGWRSKRLVSASTASLLSIHLPPNSTACLCVPAMVIRDAPVRDVISRVKRAKDSGSVVSVQCGDNGFNRAVIGLRGVHILRGIHAADKTAFDHVAAKMAADNRVAVDLDLSPLIAGRGIARQRALVRYRDLLVLQHRFGFPLTVSTDACSVLGMCAVREVSGLCSLLGMEPSEVEQALAGAAAVTTAPDPAVKVV